MARAVQGCGGSNTGPASTTNGPPAECPATPEATIGAACGQAGLTCGPEYSCGAITVTLLCVCTDGTFQCTDGTGAVVDGGDQITCPAQPTTGVCPASEKGAPLVACTEQGLSCSYPSSCPSMLDTCQCAAGTTADGGFGLRFECHPLICMDGGPPAVADSGSGEASSDGSAHDAAPADTGSTQLDASLADAEDSAADGDAMGADSSPTLDASGDGPEGASSDDAPSE